MREHKKMLAGNWKMNKTPKEAEALMDALLEQLPKTAHHVAVFPPFLALERVLRRAGNRFMVGAQNCHSEVAGAFTGEISLSMLVEIGVDAVLVGHSERRQYFCETDEDCRKKVAAILSAEKTPFLCVGETLPERQEKDYLQIVKTQLDTALSGITPKQASNVVIAYEPVWAIGTGVTATADQAEEVCAMLRNALYELFGDVANSMYILYGGSMNAGNAAELLAKPNIDGGLIGGASLKPEEFAAIVTAAG